VTGPPLHEIIGTETPQEKFYKASISYPKLRCTNRFLGLLTVEVLVSIRSSAASDNNPCVVDDKGMYHALTVERNKHPTDISSHMSRPTKERKTNV
jgi:hypothetical protein